MKKKITAFLIALMCITSAFNVLAAGIIPDHMGTNMDGILAGTDILSSRVRQYDEIFKSAGNQYGVDPNLLAAICMQESSGRNLSHREDGSEYPAWGIMQIEYTNEKLFADFGEKTTGVRWTLNDRLDPAKAVPYAAHLISKALIKYDCDYMKTLQAYNFGETVLDRIIAANGDNWFMEVPNAKNYVENWAYDSYGDAKYVEHVMRYYYPNLDYIGAKVRVNNILVDFKDQFPIIENGRTLIPVRMVAEILGATVEWNEAEYKVRICKDGKEIVLPINSSTVYVNGVEETLDVPSKLVNNRTMVPIRVLTSTFDIGIEWEEETRTVHIYK